VKLRLLPKPEEGPTFPPDVESGFVFTVDRVRDNLSTFARLRGGRMSGSSFVRMSCSAAPDPDGPHLL
jgi:Ca2+-transporting ATPase